MLRPLLGKGTDKLSESKWRRVGQVLAPYGAWLAKKPEGQAGELSVERLRQILGEASLVESVEELIRESKSKALSLGNVRLVEKLILYKAHLMPFVNSYVAFPDLYDEVVAQVVSTGERFGLDASIWTYDEILDYLNDPDNQDTILSIVFGRIGTLTSGVFEFILVFLLGPVVAFYLLIDLPNVQQRLLDLVPKGRDEDELGYTMEWLRHHDRYDDPS